MKNIFKISLWFVGTSMLLTACDNDDNWAPGPEDTEIGVVAYFPDQSTSVILSPMDPLQITTTIKRVDTTNEVTFPLTVTCTSAGLTYPDAVTFAAGQEEATYVLDCSGLPIGEFQTVTVAIPENQSDIYGPGMSSISISVIVAEWKLLSDKVTYEFGNGWNDVYGEMYILDNTKYIRMTNFFGSGLDIMTEITNASGQNFNPTTNAAWEVDSNGYNVWYFYDEANNDYPTWYPAGKDNLGLQYLYVYGDGYSKIFMINDPETLYGYGYIGGYICYDDDNWSDWLYMYMEFNLLFNPF